MYFKKAYPSSYLTVSLLLLLTSGIIQTGCDQGNDTENGQEFTGNVVTYDLQAAGDSDISGVVIFEELEGGSTVVTIELSGTPSGGDHPAHIHDNSVADGGGVAIPLNNVDGSTGVSETVIEADETGSGNLTYSELLEFDGHVNVHLSDDDFAVVAEGDIGGNALSGESITYELYEANDSGISGEVRFEERNNGNTLVTIELTGTPAEGDHPAHVHHNSVAAGGGIAVPLSNVIGDTGISVTNVRADETDTGDLTYSGLLEFDGHVNVHLSDDDFAVVSQGNIGSNYGQEEDPNNNEGNGNENGDDNGDGNGY